MPFRDCQTVAKSIGKLAEILHSPFVESAGGALLAVYSFCATTVRWLFAGEGQHLEDKSDFEVARDYWEVTLMARGHAERYGESERMDELISCHEHELRRRGYDPGKVWREVSRTHPVNRHIHLEYCREDEFEDER